MDAVISVITPYIEKGINIIADLEPIADKTVVIKSEIIQDGVKELADKVGQAPDTLLYILLMLAAYPLALVVGALPSKTARHAAFGLGGISMMQLMFGSQWIHSLVTAMGTYLMTILLPRQIMPGVVFAFVMIYMCAAHLYRMYTDYMGWSLDFTGPQMILCIKLTSFAYNYYDGKIGIAKLQKKIATLKENNRAGSNDRKIKGLERTVASQKKFAVNGVPNLLEYLGYVYCFTTIMAGPAFEYADYIHAVDGSAYKPIFDGHSNGRTNGTNGHTNGTDNGVAKGGAVNGYTKKPSSVVPGLACLGLGLLCMAIHVVGSMQFPLMGVVAEEEFLKYGMVYRAAYTWIALLFIRFKYYFAWKVAEGSCIMAGFGFEGYNEDGSVKGWGGTSNMDILGFEFSGCVSENSRSWNKRTQGWLERYVYHRTNRSLAAVYFVSAIWHGFYPGYYLFFMSVPLLTYAAGTTKTKVRPFFEASEMLLIYNFTAKILTSITINYLVTPFQLLAWDTSVTFWMSFFFIGHVSLVVVYMACSLLPKAKKPKTV
mmetsp:Transcript_37512/g.49427  ORF Transcript_37512/g.49427 Transcript_37512/m.49427 type:complete len:542 (+) Transcript_37512:178-1803(+)